MLGPRRLIIGKTLSRDHVVSFPASPTKRRLPSDFKRSRSSIKLILYSSRVLFGIPRQYEANCLQLPRSYPRLTLRLRPPIEVENLLPYDIRFRIYDKNREHNWSSFLRKGGVSPLHMADLNHLLLLSAEIQDSRTFAIYAFEAETNG